MLLEYDAADKLSKSHYCSDCGPRALLVNRWSSTELSWELVCGQCHQGERFERRKSLTRQYLEDPESVPITVANRLADKMEKDRRKVMAREERAREERGLTAVPMVETGPMAVAVRPVGGWAVAVQEMKERMVAIQDLYQAVMKKGVDYDTIPGTKKDTLLQPGAQMLDLMIGAVPHFEEMPGCIEDWERQIFYYKIRCRLINKATGETVAEGIGSCNSRESRYSDRWVWPREVPAGMDRDSLQKREFPGRDGKMLVKYCIPNDDIYSLVNTVLKMAEKRAHVAATLNATGASRIFAEPDDASTVPSDEQGAASEQQSTRAEPRRAQPSREQPRQQQPTQAASPNGNADVVEGEVVDSGTLTPYQYWLGRIKASKNDAELDQAVAGASAAAKRGELTPQEMRDLQAVVTSKRAEFKAAS